MLAHIGWRDWLDKAVAPPLVRRQGISPVVAADMAALPESTEIPTTASSWPPGIGCYAADAGPPNRRLRDRCNPQLTKRPRTGGFLTWRGPLAYAPDRSRSSGATAGYGCGFRTGGLRVPDGRRRRMNSYTPDVARCPPSSRRIAFGLVSCKAFLAALEFAPPEADPMP